MNGSLGIFITAYPDPFPFLVCLKRKIGKETVSFNFEVDREGNGEWKKLKSIEVGPGETINFPFEANEKGEWIRVSSNKDTKGTVHFAYTDLNRFPEATDPLFNGLAKVGSDSFSGGLLYGLGDNRRALGILAGNII